jgi:carboxyl-terminal processing protease
MTINLSKKMKRLLAVIIILVAANIYFASTGGSEYTFNQDKDSTGVVEPASYQSRVDKLVNAIISRYHYKKVDLNDSLSAVIYNKYINTLDFSHSYFLATDIKKFDVFKTELDDMIKDGDIEPAFEIFNTFKDRVHQQLDYAEKILQKEFDYSKNDSIEINREKEPWPADEKAAEALWYKRVKSDAINLKLTGKKWDDIVETLTKRYNNYRKAVDQYNSEDVFQQFMNAYTESIDPHTNYFSPITSDNFRINMSLSLEGIGAQLRTEDDYTKVVEIIPGGPAYKSGLLHPDDKIVGVAQGDDGEMEDVIGWRITDVVQLIRGKKGTVVRLLIIPADGGPNAVPHEIKLVRDKVKLEEQAAKDSVLDLNERKKEFKIGIIDVPAFYSDYEAQQRGDKDYKSTTRDVRRLLEQLKKEKVDGVIIDLRNNGGGSLQEAVQMTGLFIKNGPVVQVRNADGSIDVDRDPDPSIEYEGPLAVLVNRFSASASEIFTAAIQDYGRGLVIGEQTYGKGTVQNLIDLNRLMPGSDGKYGQVKLTIAKYYRINGGSTQNKGVIPDIQYPTPFGNAKEYGESSNPSALPWDQIAPTEYQKYGDLSKFIPQLIDMHDKRIKIDPEFQNYVASVKDAEASHNKKYVSLNYDIREKEKEAEEERKFERDNKIRKQQGLKLIEKGETPVEKTKNYDALLDETGHILADYILLSIG